MEWFPVVVGTAFSLLFAVFMQAGRERLARRKKPKQPPYEELKRQRDVLLFWFSFTGFWIFMVAPRVNWSYFGNPWTGLFFSVCLMTVLGIIRLIYYLIARAKPNAHGLPQEQP